MNTNQNLTPWQPGESGNPDGRPKGSKNLSSYIREMLTDESFEGIIFDINRGPYSFKGVPIKAIVSVAITKAINGDHRSMEWLAKYGYGHKLDIETDSTLPRPILNVYTRGSSPDPTRIVNQV